MAIVINMGEKMNIKPMISIPSYLLYSFQNKIELKSKFGRMTLFG